MKQFFALLLFLFLGFQVASSQSIFDLSPSQSMSITGKGPGQDAAINPFSDVHSIAIIENIGKNNFIIRVQNNAEVIKMITIKPTETKEVTLHPGQVLYLDSELESKAKVDFKKSPE